RSEPAARYRHLLWKFGVEADGEKRADEIVERFHPRTEDDQRFCVLPRHHDVVWAHSIRDIVATERGRDGKALWRAAFRQHHVNFAITIVFGGERDLFPVRGKTRERSITRTAGQTSCGPAIFTDRVK